MCGIIYLGRLVEFHIGLYGSPIFAALSRRKSDGIKKMSTKSRLDEGESAPSKERHHAGMLRLYIIKIAYADIVTSQMVPINLLQHHRPGLVQLCCPGNLGSNELARSRRCRDTVSCQCGQCFDLLPDGRVLLFLFNYRALHWHQGRTYLRNVSVTVQDSS